MVIPSYPMQVMAPATGIAAYRPPALLQAVSVLDLIELTGSTVQSAELLNLSQPTVSRRSRSIAQDLGVQRRQPDHTQGLRCGDGACLRLLRRAAKRHRLEAGVARIAPDGWLGGVLEGVDGLLPLPARFRSIQQWHALVRSHVADGALVCGQELRRLVPELPPLEAAHAAPVPWDGCLLVPLGSVPLSLVRATAQPSCRAGMPRWSGVLLPPMHCCAAIAAELRQQQKRGLHLSSGYNKPASWAQSLAGNPVEALVSPSWQRQLAATGLELETIPLATPINVEVWLLVHRRDWSKQPELGALAERIRRSLQETAAAPQRHATQAFAQRSTPGRGGGVIEQRLEQLNNIISADSRPGQACRIDQSDVIPHQSLHGRSAHAWFAELTASEPKRLLEGW